MRITSRARSPRRSGYESRGDWESDLASIEAALLRQPIRAYQVEGEEILELAKQAGSLYRTQSPAEQRRLLDTRLSNCPFDRGTLCPTYTRPFDLLSQGNESGNWRTDTVSNSLLAGRPRSGCPRMRGQRRAIRSLQNSMVTSVPHGFHRAVDRFCPALCAFSRAAKSEVTPM